MKQVTAERKHEILLEYQPHSTTHSLSALAARHAVPGGKTVVKGWYDRWDGTIESLKHKKGAGRPPLLNHAQVLRHIAPLIRAKNRSHSSITYKQLVAPVRRATGTSISARTIRRYGKRELQGQARHGAVRTTDECEYDRVASVSLPAL